MAAPEEHPSLNSNTSSYVSFPMVQFLQDPEEDLSSDSGSSASMPSRGASQDLDLEDDWVLIKKTVKSSSKDAPWEVKKATGSSWNPFQLKKGVTNPPSESKSSMFDSLKLKKAELWKKISEGPSPLVSLLSFTDDDARGEEEEHRLERRRRGSKPPLAGQTTEIHIDLNEDLSASMKVKSIREPKPRPASVSQDDESSSEARLAELRIAEETKTASFLRALTLKESTCKICGNRVSASPNLSASYSSLAPPKQNSNPVPLSASTSSLVPQTTPTELFVLDGCEHRVCWACLEQYFKQHRPLKSLDINCPISNCSSKLPHWAFKRVLSETEFDALLDALLLQAIDQDASFIKCPRPNCSFVMERLASVASATSSTTKELGLDGKPLSDEALRDRDENRFRCRACSTDFCAKCGVHPYHLGHTCDQYKEYLAARHCRFCQRPLATDTSVSVAPVSPALEVCSSEECTAKLRISCQKLHACSHVCHGIFDEETCLPCLHEECVQEGEGQTGTDYCNICWVEDLASAPCIRLDCGHVFHFQCVQKKIQVKWSGPQITFSFCECPLCKKFISHKALEKELAYVKNLYEDVTKKALRRLEFEGLQSAPEIDKPDGRFYKNPLGYAMNRFAYYPCYKCEKPYFGGQRRCDAGDQDPNAFDPKELICPSCAGITTACPVHGEQYIEHKCQYCCSVASWFCWGKTHFCDSCHSRQTKGDYVTRYPKEKHPKCPGKDRCPLKVAHPPNGEPFVLGCLLCRQMGTF